MKQALLNVKSLAFSSLVWLALSVWAIPVQAQETEVFVDPEEVTRGETVELTIRVHGRQTNIDVDVEPLRENFEIIGTRTSSQMRSVNGQVEAWTDYKATLFPRELGEQRIPALEVAGRSTQPLTINVLERDPDAERDRDLYLETTLNKDSVYVQEQLLFSIRLFYTISGIRNPDFTELELDNAVVETLGPPNQYEEVIDGSRYGVYELNYAIFPQNSGELQIPDIVFRGQLPDSSSRFGFRNNVSPVTAFTEGRTVEVRERPAEFPADQTWLPASEVSIRQSWSDDLTSLQQGDTIERTIAVEARGLDGAALPPVPTPEIDGMNSYSGNTEIDREIVDGNVVGTRTQTYSLVATDDGSVVIPPVSLPWWDIEDGELRYAELPESLVTVDAAPGSASVPQLPDQAEEVPLASNSQPDPGDGVLGTPRTPSWVLALLAALLSAIAVAIVYYLRRAAAGEGRNDRASVTAQRTSEAALNRERSAYRELHRACRQGDEQQIRLRLITWARQFFRDERLSNLDQVVEAIDNEAIRDHCHRLQVSLYGADRGDGLSRQQRENLLRELAEWRRRHRRAHGEQSSRYALPPLYNS